VLSNQITATGAAFDLPLPHFMLKLFQSARRPEMSRFPAPVTAGLGAAALGLAMLASAPVFAESYPKETVECKKGMVYDKAKKKCVKAQSGVTPGTGLTLAGLTLAGLTPAGLTDDAYRRAAAGARGWVVRDRS
jgi:hypothetical protein